MEEVLDKSGLETLVECTKQYVESGLQKKADRVHKVRVFTKTTSSTDKKGNTTTKENGIGVEDIIQTPDDGWSIDDVGSIPNLVYVVDERKKTEWYGISVGVAGVGMGYLLMLPTLDAYPKYQYSHYGAVLRNLLGCDEWEEETINADITKALGRSNGIDISYVTWRDNAVPTFTVKNLDNAPLGYSYVYAEDIEPNYNGRAYGMLFTFAMRGHVSTLGSKGQILWLISKNSASNTNNDNDFKSALLFRSYFDNIWNAFIRLRDILSDPFDLGIEDIRSRIEALENEPTGTDENRVNELIDERLDSLEVPPAGVEQTITVHHPAEYVTGNDVLQLGDKTVFTENHAAVAYIKDIGHIVNNGYTRFLLTARHSDTEDGTFRLGIAYCNQDPQGAFDEMTQGEDYCVQWVGAVQEGDYDAKKFTLDYEIGDTIDDQAYDTRSPIEVEHIVLVTTTRGATTEEQHDYLLDVGGGIAYLDNLTLKPLIEVTPATTESLQVRTGADGVEGPAGADGVEGPAGVDGVEGPAGADGKSAYEYAVDGGYGGTEADFATMLANLSNGVIDNPTAVSTGQNVISAITYDNAQTFSITHANGLAERALSCNPEALVREMILLGVSAVGKVSCTLTIETTVETGEIDQETEVANEEELILAVSYAEIEVGVVVQYSENKGVIYRTLRAPSLQGYLPTLWRSTCEVTLQEGFEIIMLGDLSSLEGKEFGAFTAVG